jgi:ribosome-binding ATPase
LKIGIIGPQGSGKTTVFNSLTGLHADGFGGKAPTLGVVQVPDPRLWVLTDMYHPKKTVPAEVVFVDLGAGGTASEKLSAITGALADADALAVVINAFDASDPAGDLDSFLLDLVLADLSLVEGRLERIALELQRGKKESQAEKPLLERLHEALAAGQRLETMALSTDEEKATRNYQFVTRKPTLVIANVGEGEMEGAGAEAVRAAAEAQGLAAFVLCAPLEAEIAQLAPEERDEFLGEYGMTEPARDRFIAAAYAVTELISFFTVGPDEVRAWSIRQGTLAPQAAGKIHTDLEKGFIRAEVVAYDHLIAGGSHQECRARGQVRLEGKTYEVQDGDILEIRFSN